MLQIGIIAIALSAYLLLFAALMLVNKFWTDVPSAIKIIAVIGSLSSIIHPNSPAVCLMNAASTPMNTKLAKNVRQPQHSLAGGMTLKITFHPIEIKCKNASNPDTS